MHKLDISEKNYGRISKMSLASGGFAPDQGLAPGRHWGTALSPPLWPSTLVPNFFVALAFK